MDYTVFYANAGVLAHFGAPEAGWYWDFSGADEPNPHGPFESYDKAYADKVAYLNQLVEDPGF